MFLAFRRPPVLRAFALAFAVTGLAACGGGGSPAGPNPNPGAPAPAPTPAPTPTPDPRIGLALGPITRFTIKPRIVEPDVRDPAQDSQGRFILRREERVDVDGTQKNASNEICAWINPPVYLVNGQNMAFNTSNGVVYRRGSSQPFLLKLTIERPGTFSVRGSIDGIDSNLLEFVVQ
jgi:hypothetical protein